MQIYWATKTHIGNQRDENQDFIFADGKLFVVADGMGGHKGGAEAAKLATEILKSVFAEAVASEPASKNLEEELRAEELLIEAITTANKAVYEEGRSKPELEGMGTTVCALYIGQDLPNPKMIAGNVGDSRLYKFDGELTQITQDHNAAWEHRQDETQNESLAHYLTRALGAESEVEVDVWELEAAAKGSAQYLLCSDGLTGEVPDERIAEIVGTFSREESDSPQEDLQNICDSLIDAALAAGGKDNISVVLVSVSKEEE